MKKLLSIVLAAFLTVNLIFIPIHAAPITRDGQDIACVDFLDFQPNINKHWATCKDGTWDCFIEPYSYSPPENENGEIIAPYLVPYENFNQNTAWSLTEKGEVLHFELTGQNRTPGLSFMIDEYHDGLFPSGRQIRCVPQAEFCKIRVKNHSKADKFTFACISAQTNSYRFSEKTISDLHIDMREKHYETESDEWQTYIFSLMDINAATNYKDSLQKNFYTGRVEPGWGGDISEILVFPFGYDINADEEIYRNASIDIDYIVFGSYEYVASYQSDLEKNVDIPPVQVEYVKKNNRPYRYGDSVKLTDFSRYYLYEDGTKEAEANAKINLEYALSCDTKTEGDVKATVTASNKRRDISIITTFSVPMEMPVKMRIDKMPDKMHYQKGDTFDPTGMALSFIYEDGAAVPLYAYETDADFSKSDTVTLHSAVNGFPLSVNLTVEVEGMQKETSSPFETEKTDAENTTENFQEPEDVSSSIDSSSPADDRKSTDLLVVSILSVCIVTVIGISVVAVFLMKKKKK